MKFRSSIYNIVLILVSVVLVVADVLLISQYGFDGQLLIAIYVLIGVVALCAVVIVMVGMVPTLIIDEKCKNIRTIGIYDVRRKNGRKSNWRFAYLTIPFDEITHCSIVGKTINLKMKWGNACILDLSYFSKNQVNKIMIEVDKRLEY